MVMHQLNVVTRQADLSQWRYYRSIFNHSIAELFAKSSILERSLVFKCFVLPFIYPHFCAMVIAQLCPNKILICTLTRFTCDINPPQQYLQHIAACCICIFFITPRQRHAYIFFNKHIKVVIKRQNYKKTFLNRISSSISIENLTFDSYLYFISYFSILISIK